MKPVIISEEHHKLSDLSELQKKSKIWMISDSYEKQLEELYYIQNPSEKLSKDKAGLHKFLQERQKTEENGFRGTWVYFPWNGQLVHILNKDEYFLVRTNRNKNIINSEEQATLYGSKVGILGLSIGNGMAVNLSYSGMSQKMVLADFDKLELSNLNRIRTGIGNLDEPKIEITSRQIYEIDPFADLDLYPEGINNKNLKEFVKKSDIIFEAIDDFQIKLKIRIEAKIAKVPVIMLTNLGDRLLIDVERYDKDPNLLMFNGLIGDIAEDILNKPISEEDKQRYAIGIVGKENVSTRVMDSVLEVNKSLVGRPQIMSTVTISGGVSSYLLRRLLLGPELISGRYLINFESLIS